MLNIDDLVNGLSEAEQGVVRDLAAILGQKLIDNFNTSKKITGYQGIQMDDTIFSAAYISAMRDIADVLFTTQDPLETKQDLQGVMMGSVLKKKYIEVISRSSEDILLLANEGYATAYKTILYQLSDLPGKLDKPSKKFYNAVSTLLKDIVNDWAPKPRILVAEDEPSILRMTTQFIKRLGYEPVCVEDGRAVLEELKKDEHYAAMILDQNMPHLNGSEVVKAIKESGSPYIKHATTPIMLYSGGADAISPESALNLGASFLSKPSSLSEFKKAVDSMLFNPNIVTNYSQAK